MFQETAQHFLCPPKGMWYGQDRVDETPTMQIGATQCIQIHPGQGRQPLHRDDSIFYTVHPGKTDAIGMMIAISDFTEENGAPWMLAGSHLRFDAPERDEFFARATRIIAPAGSVCYMDPRVWHSGGSNRTTRWRHAVTFNICRPYMKQRIDIPRIMAGIDLTGVSEKAMQKMGFLAQVPASLDEYYLPPDQRKFRQKTE